MPQKRMRRSGAIRSGTRRSTAAASSALVGRYPAVRALALTRQYLGVNPRRQDAHSLAVAWLAVAFDQRKAPASFHVDVGDFGDGGVQLQLAGEIDLNDVGKAIGLRHVHHPGALVMQDTQSRTRGAVGKI